MIFFLVCSAALCATEGTDCCAPENRPSNSWANWPNHCEIFAQARQHHSPEWAFVTIQPFYRTDCTYRNTFFFQAQVSHHKQTEFYNIGVGYRYLAPSENWMLGSNFFYDITKRHHNQRLGAGLELFYRNVTFRFNFFEPITGAYVISPTETGTALRGYAGEIEVPCPKLPWIRLYGVGFHDRKQGYEPLHGGRAIIRMNLSSFLYIQMGRDFTSRENSNFFQVTLCFGRKASIDYTIWDHFWTKDVFINRCLVRHTLEKVRRENGIATGIKSS